MVAREWERGTLEALFVTPVRSGELLLGKTIPYFCLGMIGLGLCLLAAKFLFHVPFRGSLGVLIGVSMLYLLVALGIGLLLSSVAATMQQAMLFGFVIIMPFSLLSGLTTPISSMPTTLQYVTMVNPLRYAIDIAQRVYLEGVGLDRLGSDLWPLAVLATLTLTTASWMFRRRLE